MRVAIVCDWLVTIGGAEKVLTQMLECFPQSDIFTTVNFLKHGTFNNKVTTSFIQKLPFAKRLYRFYLPLMLYAIESFDLSEYDVVISSSHSIAKGVLTGPNQLHICYCHSPMRYAYDMQHEYLSTLRWFKRLMASRLLHKIRLWDNRNSNGVDYFIANSYFIAARIDKAYKRSSTVIYPPVDFSCNTATTEHDDYYITASRLVQYKNVNIIAQAFMNNPKRKLIIIGDGPMYKKILRMVKNHPNIILMGYQENHVLRQYIAKAKAFIFAAKEDFGISMVEALSAHTPVIAYAVGGAKEIVDGVYVDKKLDDKKKYNGVFYVKQDSQCIIKAIDYFEDNIEHFDASLSDLEKFSTNSFKDKFKQFVLDKYNNRVI